MVIFPTLNTWLVDVGVDQVDESNGGNDTNARTGEHQAQLLVTEMVKSRVSDWSEEWKDQKNGESVAEIEVRES